MNKFKYFVNSPGHGTEFFDTKEEAIKFTNECIDDYRDDACDGWDDSVEWICWGKIEQYSTMINQRPITDEDRENLNIGDNVKFICDYELRDI